MKMNYQVRLISNNIFPQDANGKPIYNPAGKYIVKLFVNGTWRAVTVDDYFPRSKFDTWSGAYSGRGKLWVNILEKAYLKLHGGYDFPGSNSSRDLYVLTGWLPQSYRMAKMTISKEDLWKKILYGMSKN
jgi:calpain-7